MHMRTRMDNDSGRRDSRCTMTTHWSLRHCALLLVLLFLALCASPPSSVVAAPYPSAVVIGVILPLSGPTAAAGQRVRSVLSMLAAEVNGGAAVGGFPPNYLGAPLTLAFADSAGSPVQGMRALHTLRSAHGAQLLGVIGDLTDEVTVPLSLLASQLGVPLISPGARSPSLSLKRDHPLFARTIPSEDLFALLWASAMPLLSWFRVALLTVDDDNGRGFADLLLRSTSAYEQFDPVANATVRPFEVTAVVLPAGEAHMAVSALAQTLDQLYESGVRIFALHAGHHNERVLRMAHERGMVGTGPDGILRQWAGQFCTEEIAAAAASEPEMLLGAICNTPPVPRVWPDLPLHAAAVDLEDRIRAFDPLLFPADRHIAHLDVAAGTALFTFVGLLGSAFADPSLSNSGADVMGQLRSRGMVVLQADGQPMLLTQAGDAIVNPDIQCWNLRARRFVVGGIFDLRAGSFNMTAHGITYVTGGVDVPKDRDRVYVTGDVLPQSVDGKIVVLAFVIIVLGAWTALILLEQALSFWSRGIWLHAVGWVALAALAFGSASVWPNGLLLLASITLDVDAHINISMWSIAVGAVYPSVLLVGAFLLALHGVDGGRKPAANVNADEISAVTGQSSTTGASAAAGADKKAVLGSAGRVSGRLRAARSSVAKQLGKLKEFIVDTSKRSWRQLVGASLALTFIFCTQCLITIAGFYLRAEFRINIVMMVLMCLVSFALNVVALSMYFHVTRSGARYLAPFVLCVSLMLPILGVIEASEWTYDKRVDISRAALDGTVAADYTLAVVVAAISASLCVLLMAFNVNRLRLSRNVLDKVLAQVAGQVRALESDIDDEKEHRHALKEQAQYFRRALEVINMCRPVWRPYAVALAMADPDDEATVAQAEKLAAQAAAAAAAAAGPQAQRPQNSPANKKRGGPKERSLTGPQSDDDEEHLESHNPISKEKKHAPPPRKSVAGSLGAAAAAAAGGDEAPAEQSQSAPKSPEGSGGDNNNNTNTTGATLPVPSLPGATSSPEQRVRKVAATRGTAAAPAAAAASAPKSSSGPSDFSRVHPPKNEKQLLTLLKELDELSLTTAPPARVTSDIRLPQILSNPMTIELIKDVLAKNLSPENIALWIDIQRYRSLDNAQVRKAVADEICQTFIVTGAKFEVNISSFMRDYVRAQVQKGSSALDLFDEVEREIYRLMVTNNTEPLVQSHMIKLAAIVLQHPDYKLPSAALVNNARGEIGGNVPNCIGVVQAAAQPAGGYVWAAPAGSPQSSFGIAGSIGRQPSSGASHASVIYVQPAAATAAVTNNDRAVGTPVGLYQRPVAAAAAASSTSANPAGAQQLAPATSSRQHLASPSGHAGFTLVRSNTFNKLRPG